MAIWRIVLVAGLMIHTGCTAAGPTDTQSQETALLPPAPPPPPPPPPPGGDPGPRPGPAGAGGPFEGLSEAELAAFDAAREAFDEIEDVPGGLGPTFNGMSCGQCHAQPDVGGTSPHPTLGQVTGPNPQVALATLDRVPGGAQAVPSFIAVNGPIREARFIENPDGSRDGGVHGLYTIAGRVDAPGCTLPQPNFPAQLAAGNVVFRIPTPVFGAGLIEAISDETLETNLAANASQKAADGISGRFNRNGNDGTITRFGWKAQNKSMMMFAGEAYNVEQGVTNPLFPNERSGVPGCVFNALPEDDSDLETGEATDVVVFALFARLSAPPTSTVDTFNEEQGAQIFRDIGCAHCHTPVMTTGESRFTGMSGQVVHAYSDFALHNMGAGLADFVQQGVAGDDEFRTAPLWGVGQRIFFMHDGRSTPANGGLVHAIQSHAGPGSEANTVIGRWNNLPSQQKQRVLQFLRAL